MIKLGKVTQITKHAPVGNVPDPIYGLGKF
jgi:hypothetical protein